MVLTKIEGVSTLQEAIDRVDTHCKFYLQNLIKNSTPPHRICYLKQRCGVIC